MYEALVAQVRYHIQKAEFMGLKEAESTCLLKETADAIEKMQDALLLMVLQYCTTNDGLLYNSFMTAGEYAFALLGVENGQQADSLWNKLSDEKPQKEETE